MIRPSTLGERAGQPVDLVDDNGVDPPRLNIGEQLQSGPIQRRAGEPAVVISRALAFVPLAVDEGLCLARSARRRAKRRR
jgi:hypothetical protein